MPKPLEILCVLACLFVKSTRQLSSQCTAKYLEDATILDCRDMGLSRIPQVNDIVKRNIDVIDLSNNNIRTLPSGAFSRLPPAKTILLENNKISQIDNDAFQSREHVIETINLSGNNLTSLPLKPMHRLRNLKRLLLGRNNIVHSRYDEAMIAELDRGFWLQELALDFNPLGTFYENGYKLGIDLENLNIAHTGIRSLPWYVKDLTNLNTLDMSGNRIRITKREENILNQLQRLRVLRMCEMKLRQVPRLRLQSLKEFYIEHNRISLLPAGAFQDLDSLEMLSLNKNRLRVVSEHAFRGIEDTLQKISVSDCSLNEFPVALAHLTNIKHLTLSENRLSGISNSALRHKRNLEVLHLDNNRFEHVPNTVRHLKNLKILSFSNNDISEIDVNVFYELTRLEYIHFEGNQITSVNPVIFSGLKGPMKINMVDNQITHVDICFLKTKVDLIYLQGNQLVCDCALYWLLKDKKVVDSHTRCHGSGKYAGYSLRQMVQRVDRGRSCPKKDKEMYLGYC